MKYPKIQSLWKREGGTYTPEQIKNLTPEQKATRQNFIEGDYSKPEFGSIKHWLVTEKIDGMNIRIHGKRYQLRGESPDYEPTDIWEISFAGRTDNAQLPPKLLKWLQGHFTPELFENVFSEAEEVLLFGEGYGPKIQSGGYYGPEQRFVLFDVLIDQNWWMEWDTVDEMARHLHIERVPRMTNEFGLECWTEEQIVEYVKSIPDSMFADDKHVTEGVVARAYPMMMFRSGGPIKFKLKCKDFK